MVAIFELYYDYNSLSKDILKNSPNKYHVIKTLLKYDVIKVGCFVCFAFIFMFVHFYLYIF